MKQHLLVLLEKVRGFKQFGPFRFPLKNLICDAEACADNTHHETIKQYLIAMTAKKRDTKYKLVKWLQ